MLTKRNDCTHCLMRHCYELEHLCTASPAGKGFKTHRKPGTSSHNRSIAIQYTNRVEKEDRTHHKDKFQQGVKYENFDFRGLTAI